MSLKLKDINIKGTTVVTAVGATVDTSTGTPQPYIPIALHQQNFHTFHHLAHLSVCATQHLISSRSVWVHMNAGMRDWVHACTVCQHVKVPQ